MEWGKGCKLACPEHARAKWLLEHNATDALRANLPKFERLAKTVWAPRCTCGMIEHIREAIRG